MNIIEAVEKDIYQEIDGFYVFDTHRGYISAYELRELADELDRRNADWESVIAESFKNEYE